MMVGVIRQGLVGIRLHVELAVISGPINARCAFINIFSVNGKGAASGGEDKGVNNRKASNYEIPCNIYFSGAADISNRARGYSRAIP